MNTCSGRQTLISEEPFLHFFADNLAIKDPFFKKFKPWPFQTRDEQYDISLQKHLYINRRCKELGLTDPVDKFYYTE